MDVGDDVTIELNIPEVTWIIHKDLKFNSTIDRDTAVVEELPIEESLGLDL